MTNNTFAFPRNAFLGFDHIFDELNNIQVDSRVKIHLILGFCDVVFVATYPETSLRGRP